SAPNSNCFSKVLLQESLIPSHQALSSFVLNTTLTTGIASTNSRISHLGTSVLSMSKYERLSNLFRGAIDEILVLPNCISFKSFKWTNGSTLVIALLFPWIASNVHDSDKGLRSWILVSLKVSLMIFLNLAIGLRFTTLLRDKSRESAPTMPYSCSTLGLP